MYIKLYPRVRQAKMHYWILRRSAYQSPPCVQGCRNFCHWKGTARTQRSHNMNKEYALSILKGGCTDRHTCSLTGGCIHLLRCFSPKHIFCFSIWTQGCTEELSALAFLSHITACRNVACVSSVYYTRFMWDPACITLGCRGSLLRF